MNYRNLVLAITLAIVPTASMAQSTSASRYGASEALSVQDARLGEVLMVRQVTIQNDRSFNSGSAVGAAVGYAAAQQVEGSYRDAARFAGSVIGGVAGTSVQRRLSGRSAIEIYVRDFSRNGRVVVIVQDHTDGTQQGDRVFLVGAGSKTRVVPIPETWASTTQLADPFTLPSATEHADGDDVPPPSHDPPPPTSHFLPMHCTPDVHEGDWLFEGVARGDPLLEALYRVSLTQRIDVDAIDRALDAHLAAHGEPEQVAYAKGPCLGYDRTLPLTEPKGDDSDYVREHRAWNPLTQREIAFGRSGA